jgi:hypothetical protein
MVDKEIICKTNPNIKNKKIIACFLVVLVIHF